MAEAAAIPEMPDPGESIFRDLIEHIGCRASRLATSDAKTADFVIDGGGPSLLCELKSRETPLAIQTWLNGNCLDTFETRIGADDRLQEKIRDANAQLTMTERERHDVPRIVAMVCLSPIQSAYFCDHLEALCLGVRQVLVHGSTDPIAPRCLFAARAQLLRHKAVEAVLGMAPRGNLMRATLLVNPLAARLDQLRATRLYKQFLERSAVVDIGDPSTISGYWLADLSLERGTPGALETALALKYGVRAVTLVEMDAISAGGFLSAP